MVVVDVELVARDDEFDVGAELARLGHLRARLHAERLRLDARGDAYGGIREHGNDAERTPAQPRLDLLLDGGKIRVEIDEQRPERHGFAAVAGRVLASVNLRRKTSGSAMSGIGATALPAPEM